MHPQDVTDDKFAAEGFRLGYDGFGFGNGFCQGFFDKNVAAGLHGGQGVGCVGVRVTGDGNSVGAGKAQGLCEIVEAGERPAQFGEECGAGGLGTGDQSRDSETREVVVGQGVGAAHVTGADAEDSNRGRHGGMVAGAAVFEKRGGGKLEFGDGGGVELPERWKGIFYKMTRFSHLHGWGTRYMLEKDTRDPCW